MDVNLKRRARELAMADELAKDVIAASAGRKEPVPIEVVAHHFGLICERHKYVPTEKSATRIFEYTQKLTGKLRRELDAVAKSVNRAADDMEGHLRRLQ